MPAPGVPKEPRSACLTPQLPFELVNEAPIRAIGKDSIGARLDHAHLAKPQRIEAQRVFGIVFMPAIIGGLAQRLRSVLQLAAVAPAHDKSGGMLGIASTQVGGHQDRPQRPLGRYGVLAHEILVCPDYAAE